MSHIAKQVIELRKEGIENIMNTYICNSSLKDGTGRIFYSFQNCEIKELELEKCTCKCIRCINCDIDGLVVKDTNIHEVHFINCRVSNVTVKTSKFSVITFHNCYVANADIDINTHVNLCAIFDTRMFNISIYSDPEHIACLKIMRSIFMSCTCGKMDDKHVIPLVTMQTCIPNISPFTYAPTRDWVYWEINPNGESLEDFEHNVQTFMLSDDAEHEEMFAMLECFKKFRAIYLKYRK